MTPSAPLLTSSSTILWLKVIVTAVLLGALYHRYRNRNAPSAAPSVTSPQTKALLVFAVLFSFAVFHNLGDSSRRRTFVHYGEMFHYYLGAKYFEELGHFELYNAVIVADAEQDSALASLPFYTDLTTYQNAPREAALERAPALKGLFSGARWNAFKEDVSFFKMATGASRSPAFSFLLMDHGYNASPVSTVVLGMLTNIVPVTKLWLLAALDPLVVAAMVVLVFGTFGYALGALFAVMFFVNVLNDHSYISGGLLRYDWLVCVVVAVCLLEKGRHASAAFFLTLAGMLKVFPLVLLYGVGVAIVRKARATGKVEIGSIRFVIAAGVTGLALFLLPALSLGSVVRPWQEFATKTALHDDGVYVNHLGLRGMVLIEPSHLSLDKFVEAYRDGGADLVRHWQDVKEQESREKKPIVVFFAFLVLVCVTAVVWKEKTDEVESMLWPLFLVYAISYPSHYYYVFLSLLVLLFFRRANSRSAFVPLCLLLVFNIAALVTDSFTPSPIVFYTLLNIYLCACLASILGFELYSGVFGRSPELLVATVPEPTVASSGSRKVSPRRGRGKRN